MFFKLFYVSYHLKNQFSPNIEILFLSNNFLNISCINISVNVIAAVPPPPKTEKGMSIICRVTYQ